MEARRPRVLCVDDEPHVLEGLTLHLRRRYEVGTAISGPAGLEDLAKHPGTAVVVSDMRMPGMNGAVFLGKARQMLPDASRLLLTGHADLESAIAAVNDGQLFRFLTKPCPAPALVAAVDAAAEHHRLVTAERELLEKTLHGSIKTLTEVLALTNPVAFGRANRIKRHVSEVADKLRLRERWQIEVAAMLSQLGCITLPAETVEKMHYGKPLTEAEEKMVVRMPAVAEQLLAHIPRLEAVRAILAGVHKPPLRREPGCGFEGIRLIERGAQMLRIAQDLDELETRGDSPALAMSTLRGRSDQYDAELLEAFSELVGVDEGEVRELPVVALRVGMVLLSEVKTVTGTLLVARGYEVTAGLLERLRNFKPGTIKEPIRTVLHAATRPAS